MKTERTPLEQDLRDRAASSRNKSRNTCSEKVRLYASSQYLAYKRSSHLVRDYMEKEALREEANQEFFAKNVMRGYDVHAELDKLSL